MKVISAIACSTAVIGTFVTGPAAASTLPTGPPANFQLGAATGGPPVNTAAPIPAAPPTGPAPATQPAAFLAELAPLPPPAAEPAHCASVDGGDTSNIDGRTGCRATSYSLGTAGSLAVDGVGYAMAADGGASYGGGAAGGFGASESIGATSIALGLGPDAFALTSLMSPHEQAEPAFAVSLALEGSRSHVLAGEPVTCLGAAALAWNSTNGDMCVSTPLGNWRSDAPMNSPPEPAEH